jgi:hypothetical protein
MTQVHFDQFEFISERSLRHAPTGIVLNFPLSQPRSANGLPLCHIEGGDTAPASGERYDLRQLIAAARDCLLTRTFARAS